MSKQTNTKQSTKQSTSVQKLEKKVTKVIEEEVDDVEEAEVSDNEVEELVEAEEEAEEDEDEVDEVEDVEEADKTTTKKNSKIEYNCDSPEDALNEYLRVDSEIEQLMKYRKAVFKVYQKLNSKQLKQSKKRRNNRSDTPKEATGFIKAKTVPEKFKLFFGKHLKTDEVFNKYDMSVDQPRTDITKMIYQYIRTNKLYEKNEDGTFNKRVIKPDDCLKDLLSIEDGQEIGFNNFQSYVSRLYNTGVVAEASGEEDADEQTVQVSKPKSKSKQVVSSSAK